MEHYKNICINNTKDIIKYIETQKDNHINEYWKNNILIYIFNNHIKDIEGIFNVYNNNNFIGNLTKDYIEKGFKRYSHLLRFDINNKTINLLLKKINEYSCPFRNMCILYNIHYRNK